MALVAAASESGAINSEYEPFVRSVTWVAGLNGIMMLDRLERFDLPEVEVASMCRRNTADLARGWGADADRLGRALEAVEALRSADGFVPKVPRWSDGETDSGTVGSTADGVDLSQAVEEANLAQLSASGT